tara:strand:+ start:8516 stop:9295 length:780 start_codon:yes stop_codon:yes gene_type:complete
METFLYLTKMSNDCNPIPCDCIDGSIGLQGLAGPKGKTGVPGIDGNQGIQGIIGDDGIQGEIGIQGIQGVTGNNVTGTTGNTGAQGQNGATGPIGLQGLDGLNGVDGTDGTNISQPAAILVTGGCFIPNPGAQELLECGALAVSDGTRVFLEKYGNGYYRVDLPNGVRNVGDTVNIYGVKNMSRWFIRTHTNNTIEMTAFNSTTANISTLGTSGVPSNYRGVYFEETNGSDCIEIIYIGDDRWVITEAIFASGVIPTFT